MSEALYGLIGVLVGAAIPWIQSYWTDKRATRKHARYLAIRIVCLLDKYLEDCAEVVKDDGLCYGQRNAEGSLEAQVKAPQVLVFPDDVDWKSIDHELMYALLSFPSEIEAGNRMIKGTLEFASAPDYEEWFLERKFYYCQFGLAAYSLSDKLCRKYKIKKKSYNDWNPLTDLSEELASVTRKRQKRMASNAAFVTSMLGRK